MKKLVILGVIDKSNVIYSIAKKTNFEPCNYDIK